MKDHMREAGDVCFADVYKDGVGVCEYVRYEDMKYALKKLDDTKFKSHEVCNFLMQEIHFRFYESISIIPYIPKYIVTRGKGELRLSQLK